MDFKVMIIGDLHNSSRGYGNHVDYPGETLGINEKIIEIGEKEKVTHIIDTGDFTYGAFNLEYRTKFERLLIKQNEITNGNRITIKGNHDTSSNGVSEWDYYVKERKLLKTLNELELNGLKIHFMDYGKEKNEINIDKEKENLLIAHNYFLFKDTKMANYGSNFIQIEEMENIKDIDMIVLGHIHEYYNTYGYIDMGEYNKKVGLVYLGSPSRPSYQKGLEDIAHVMIIEAKEDGSVNYIDHHMDLIPVEKAFMVGDLAKDIKKIDIKDILDNLNNKEGTVGDTEQIIKALQVKEVFKNKALKLLKDASML